MASEMASANGFEPDLQKELSPTKASFTVRDVEPSKSSDVKLAPAAEKVVATSFRSETNVTAIGGWQKACAVKHGDHIIISAHNGTWNIWPDGGPLWISNANGTKHKSPNDFPLPSAVQGALIGKIGSRVFLIGTSTSITVLENGELFLSCNDSVRHRPDNQGAIVAVIELTRSNPK